MFVDKFDYLCADMNTHPMQSGTVLPITQSLNA